MNKKSNTLPFSLSKSLVKENLKLYWGVPFLTFLGYFLCCIFPMMLGLRTNSIFVSEYVELTLNMKSPLPWFLVILFSLMAALRMTSYIHNPNACLSFVSQPYTRGKLFGSHLLTGYLMLIIPVILVGIMYLGYYPITYDMSGFSYYTKTMVFDWVMNMIYLTTFNYGLFTLAAYLSGTAIIAFLLSGVLFFIVPVLAMTINGYLSIFITGYNKIPFILELLIEYSNPAFRGLTVSISQSNLLFYFFMGLVFILIAMVVFKYTKLERVGDSLLSNITEHIVTAVLVFEGMALFGIVAKYLGQSYFTCIIGLILGLLITFFIVKLIIDRSVNIFNKKNAVSFILCVLVGVFFTLFVIFDIGGISRRVPDIEDVASVDIKNMVESISSNVDIDLHEGDSINEILESNEFYCNDKDLIEKIVVLHKLILDKKNYIDNNEFDRNHDAYRRAIDYEETEHGQGLYCDTISFEYKLKNGVEFSRLYNVKLNDEIIQAISDIVSSESYKEQYKIPESVRKSINSMIFSPYLLDDNADEEVTPTLFDKKKINHILDICEKKALSYDYSKIANGEFAAGSYLGGMELFPKKPFNDEDYYRPIGYISVKDNDVEILEYLKSIKSDFIFDSK